MLTELRIRQVAIIDAVSLTLVPGLNVLTGETGAGKSIIIEALGLLCGARAHADVVRSGSEKATVEGVFDVGGDRALAPWLEAQGLATEDGLLLLRREVSAAGRSRAWINDTAVTTSVLAELGARLVTVHGQHDSRGLMEPETQRAILDAFAGATGAAERVAQAWDALAAVRAERETLAARRAQAERRADYLRHVVEELGAAQLVAGEEGRLDDEARRLNHVGELRLHVEQVRASIEDEEQGALRALAIAHRALSAAARVDPSLDGMRQLLEAATVQLEEVARDAAHYEDGLDVDPQRLGEVERRRDLIYRLTRKHGGSVESALEVLREARGELEVLDTAAIDLGALAQREVERREALAEAAAALTAARTRGATRLQRAVDKVLPQLGLSGGRFTVLLRTLGAPERTGAEAVEFHVALNEGHEARPLARVASGGELARVMLALTTILARSDGVPTLVFDEVDAGIGGKVALQVADTMRQVAGHHQVLAITHLAQIASRAHRHVVVSKGARGGVTTADLTVVEGEARVEETARMLGGDAASAVGRTHARELLGAVTAER